jgi:hypothetical protein
VKKLWKFHHFFHWKMSEKQTTFFTVNCAGKIDSVNQWYLCFSVLNIHCSLI